MNKNVQFQRLFLKENLRHSHQIVTMLT